VWAAAHCHRLPEAKALGVVLVSPYLHSLCALFFFSAEKERCVRQAREEKNNNKATQIQIASKTSTVASNERSTGRYCISQKLQAHNPKRKRVCREKERERGKE
jgi:hypothetical protein